MDDVSWFIGAGEKYARTQTNMADDGFCTIPEERVGKTVIKKTWANWCDFCKGCINVWGEPRTYTFEIEDSDGTKFPCSCIIHDVKRHDTAPHGLWLVRLVQYPKGFPSARGAVERIVKHFLAQPSNGVLLVPRPIVFTDTDPIIAKPGDIPTNPIEADIDNNSHRQPGVRRNYPAGSKRKRGSRGFGGPADERRHRA